MVIEKESASQHTEGLIFDIQHFSIHDGPGIRTIVFMKGCPLGCPWCANPESIKPYPELGLIKSECNSCGKCASVCTQNAISFDQQHKPVIDRNLCNNCGRCIEVCFPKALFIYGYFSSPYTVFTEVQKDKTFYANSGGGITLSGGEPLFQPRFAKELLTLCRDSGIHTAIETTGAAPAALFQDILSLTDYVLFDLKFLDPQKHQFVCGCENKLIRQNALTLSKSRVPHLFRIPYIPGYNNDPGNLSSIGQFIKEAGGPQNSIELMPYHRLGTSKYEYIGRKYRLEQVEAPSENELLEAKTLLKEMGLIVV